MTIHHAARLVPLDSRLQAFAHDAEKRLGDFFDLFIVSGLRTDEEQAALYAKGRTVSSGICVCAHHPLGRTVTNAKDARQSPHGRAAAFDFAPAIQGKLLWDAVDKFMAVGLLAEREGLVWGGRFKSPKDWGHIELPDWRTLTYPQQEA